MAIPASDLVKIVPRVLAGAGQDLVFNGLFLTASTLAPVHGLLTFYSAESVADYFGETSNEAAAAAVYFGGYNNSLTKPQSIFFYRANTEAVAGFFRGGPAPALSVITAISAGTLTGQIGTEAISLSGVDLSGAASYSAAAETLQTALRAAGTGTAVTAATVTYSSLTGAFTITAGTAAAGVNVDITGGTVAEALGFTAAGAAVSPGADAETWTQILNTVAAQSQNFATFTTVTELTSAADALAIAGWVQTQYNTGSQFLHVLWTTDAAVTVAGDTTSPVAQVRETEPEGVAAVYGGIKYAAFIMGAAASIAWNYANSTITFAFKAQAGLGANVQDQAVAAVLKAGGINFMGNYATRNDDFVFLQPGACFGRFAWIDTYLNATWLNSALQTQIMAGFEMAPRVPYTDAGYTMIRAWVQDVADRAINNGVIDLGVSLSQTQRAELMREAGVDITTELYNSGYYLQIVDAPAATRQARESPACNFWYTYGGSVHRLNLPSTAIV